MAQPAFAMAGWAASFASLAAARRVSNVKHSDQSHIRVSPPRSGPGCRIRMPSAGRFPLIRSLDSRIARGPRGLCIAKSRVAPAPSAAARDARVYVEAGAKPPGTSSMRASPRCGNPFCELAGDGDLGLVGRDAAHLQCRPPLSQAGGALLRLRPHGSGTAASSLLTALNCFE